MDTNYITGLLLLLLFGGLLSFFIYALYNTYKGEQTKKEFTPNMKTGDKVYFPVASGSVNCEVVEIDGDNVKVTLTINKSRLYPNGDN